MFMILDSCGFGNVPLSAFIKNANLCWIFLQLVPHLTFSYHFRFRIHMSLNLSYCIGFLDHVSTCRGNPQSFLDYKSQNLLNHLSHTCTVSQVIYGHACGCANIYHAYISNHYIYISKVWYLVQKIQVYTSLTSLPIQSLERFSLLFRRENQVHFLLEDQSS